MRIFLAITILLSIVTKGTCQSSNVDFGFLLEIVKRNNRVDVNENVYNRAEIKNLTGFTIGWNSYYLLKQNFKLRTTIGTQFEEDEINFSNSLQTEKKQNQLAFLKSGFHGILRTTPAIPVNVIAGLSPSLEFGNLEEGKSAEIKFKKLDITVDIGLSYTISFKSFKFSPELKYSKSFINSWDDNNRFGNAINNFYRDRIYFSLTFHQN